MSSLQLSLMAGNQQVTANLSWSGAQPNGVIDYIILYYANGSNQIHSTSTQSLSVVIHNLINDTIYNFYAVAYLSNSANGQRLSETSVQQTIPATLPQAPTNLQAVVSVNGAVIAGEVDLTWSASISDQHYPVLNYKLYQSSDNTNFTLIAQPTGLNYNVQGLANGNTYYFAVSAVSALGEGARCSSVSAYPSCLASAPLNLTVNFDPDASNSQQLGYQSVDLSWNAPASNGGNAVSGYVIQYSLDHTFQSGVATVNSVATSVNDLQDANLMIPFADRQTSTGWYFFRVCAVTSLGNGAFCDPATIIPSATPDQVQGLAISNLNENGDHEAGCVSLAWDYAVNASCPLLGYIITYLDSNGDPQSLYIYEPDRSPTHTIRELQNGFQYVFNVMAFNILSIGESSNASIVPSTIPDAPDLSVDGHGDGSISLSWDVPYDEGDAITGYNLYRSLNNSNFSIVSSNQSGLSYNDTGLNNGTTYYYKVSAINANGEGLLSDSVSEYPSTVPSIAQNIVVTPTNRSNNGQQLTITWDAPASTGGSPIEEYMILVFTETDALGFASAGLNRSYVLNGLNGVHLINGDTYYIVVRAINRDGFTDSANDRQHMASGSPTGLPDAPSNVRIQINNNFLVIFWNLLAHAPSNLPNDENSAILNYKIYRDGVLIQTVDGNTSSYADFSIVGHNGVVYEYQVSAVSANGEGALSAGVLESSAFHPDVPANFQAQHGDSEVLLSWNLLNTAPYPAQNPSDEGRAVTSYNIYKSSDNISFSLATTVSGSANNVTISNLINGNVQYFKLSATNNRGESDLTSAISCTPSASPDVPRSVTIYPYDSGVEISWEAPSDQNGNPNGGLGFTYTVRINDLGGGLAYQASAITNPLLNVTGLADDQQYVLTLYADNGVDTDYNVYSANFTIIPNPIPLSSLQMTSQSQQQINLQFSYKTAVYSIAEFLLSVTDINQRLAGYAVIEADRQSIIAGDFYTYNFAINPATVNMPQLNLNDRLTVSMYAINQIGEISPVSNVVNIN